MKLVDKVLNFLTKMPISPLHFCRISTPLSGKSFFWWGLVLMLIKYNLDRIIAGVFFDKQWVLFDSDAIKFYLWQLPFHDWQQPYIRILIFSSLPFLVLGTVLTLRRLNTLGWHPGWALLFFVPIIKFIFFATLCLAQIGEAKSMPPRLTRIWGGFCDRVCPTGAIGSAIFAILVTLGLGLPAVILGTVILPQYGWTMFIGLPFAMGFISVLMDSSRVDRKLLRCLLVANLTNVLLGALLLAVALEGIICLLMAMPLAVVLSSIGGLMAYAVQKSHRWRNASPKLFCSVVLILPVAMKIEHTFPPFLPLIEVKSSLVIDAPPARVWQHVVSFSQLPEPKEFIFKLGVAYPVRAEISGCGVGAVRKCNFSTGPFVEPITVWNEPNLLKFSVTKNPAPLQEWTPYRSVHPAHLDGYLESKAGQFRLVQLEDGKTLLEGTTWYQHRLWPTAYWQLWSDAIIHTIHLRVLNHVKQLSESQP